MKSIVTSKKTDRIIVILLILIILSCVGIRVYIHHQYQSRSCIVSAFADNTSGGGDWVLSLRSIRNNDKVFEEDDYSKWLGAVEDEYDEVISDLRLFNKGSYTDCTSWVEYIKWGYLPKWMTVEDKTIRFDKDKMKSFLLIDPKYFSLCLYDGYSLYVLKQVDRSSISEIDIIQFFEDMQQEFIRLSESKDKIQVRCYS